jgi:hypothetical protein
LEKKRLFALVEKRDINVLRAKKTIFDRKFDMRLFTF